MPRLTNQEYLKRHRFLKALWNHSNRFYSMLDPNQQMNLHGYYIQYKDLSEEELLEHRRAKDASSVEPGLPQVAGKSFATIYSNVLHSMQSFDLSFNPADIDSMTKLIPKLEALIYKRVPNTPSPRGRSKGVRVSFLMKPEPDIEKLARALIMIAEKMTGEQREEFKKSKKEREDVG